MHSSDKDTEMERKNVQSRDQESKYDNVLLSNAILPDL